MTAVFGFSFGHLLCKEGKGSGAMFSALDLAFKQSVTDVEDKVRLSIDSSILSFSNPSNLNSDNNRQLRPENDDSRFRVVL